jgi:hypothetical protein
MSIFLPAICAPPNTPCNTPNTPCTPITPNPPSTPKSHAYHHASSPMTHHRRHARSHSARLTMDENVTFIGTDLMDAGVLNEQTSDGVELEDRPSSSPVATSWSRSVQSSPVADGGITQAAGAGDGPQSSSSSSSRYDGTPRSRNEVHLLAARFLYVKFKNRRLTNALAEAQENAARELSTSQNLVQQLSGEVGALKDRLHAFQSMTSAPPSSTSTSSSSSSADSKDIAWYRTQLHDSEDHLLAAKAVFDSTVSVLQSELSTREQETLELKLENQQLQRAFLAAKEHSDRALEKSERQTHQLQSAMDKMELALTEQKVKTSQAMEQLIVKQQELEAHQAGLHISSSAVSSSSTAVSNESSDAAGDGQNEQEATELSEFSTLRLN